MRKLLLSGLGGGLDVVNALLPYFAAKKEHTPVVLGSSRPAPLSDIIIHSPFSDCGTWICPDTKINYPGRYIEPRLSELLKENILYFSRKTNQDNGDSKVNVPMLTKAIVKARQRYFLTDLLFVDGGGDSLTLRTEDIPKTAQDKSPFEGGDAQVLEALSGMKNAYLMVISVGLDVHEENFQRNLIALAKKDAYFGRVNLLTGEKENYLLDNLISFQGDFLQDYFKLAKQVLVLSDHDLTDPLKKKSHTAVVTYHALKENYGLQRTYVRWEPSIDGKKGVIVKPEHCWAYFFDAGRIYETKKELNNC